VTAITIRRVRLDPNLRSRLRSPPVLVLRIGCRSIHAVGSSHFARPGEPAPKDELRVAIFRIWRTRGGDRRSRVERDYANDSGSRTTPELRDDSHLLWRNADSKGQAQETRERRLALRIQADNEETRKPREPTRRKYSQLVVGRQGLEPWTLGLKDSSSPEERRVLTSPALQAGAIGGTGLHPRRPQGPIRPLFFAPRLPVGSCTVAEGLSGPSSSASLTAAVPSQTVRPGIARPPQPFDRRRSGALTEENP
jgi:hypothetical protein